MKTAKNKAYLVAALMVPWLAIGILDFTRVHSFEKPIFCIGTNLHTDGGSGHYVGLGYSFDIEGNFIPEDELPGVTKYVERIWGIPIRTGIRD